MRAEDALHDAQKNGVNRSAKLVDTPRHINVECVNVAFRVGCGQYSIFNDGKSRHKRRYGDKKKYIGLASVKFHICSEFDFCLTNVIIWANIVSTIKIKIGTDGNNNRSKSSFAPMMATVMLPRMAVSKISEYHRAEAFLCSWATATTAKINNKA